LNIVPFEQIRRVLEMMNRINAPYQHIQRQFDQISRMSQPFLQIQKQLSQTNQMPSPPHQILLQSNQIASALRPLVANLNQPGLSSRLSEVIQSQQKWIDQVKLISGFNHPKIPEWHSTLYKLANSSLVNTSVTVPGDIYDSLNELTSQIEVPKNEGSSDLPGTITVRATEQSGQNKLTWYELLALLIAIWQTIAPYHISYLEGEQQQLIVNEMKKQTSLQEQHLLIDSQRLEVEKQQLELTREQLAQQKELEEKYDQLIRMIESHISESHKDHPNGE
jgi:hypothetical protein